MVPDRAPRRRAPQRLHARRGDREEHPAHRIHRSLIAPAYRISELFFSLQGEGPSAGSPAHFLRLQGCDVGCVWCDSKYTWDADGGRALALDEIWRELDSLGRSNLLVVTGGEPLEHGHAAELLEGACARWARVEVETSGVRPPPRSIENLFYNVSPKLPSATPRAASTWDHVAAWVAEPRATFKIVVGDPPDLEAALRRIRDHDLPRDRVMLMPEGLTEARLRERAAALAPVCMREGLRLSPRLHIWMWGARRGV